MNFDPSKMLAMQVAQDPKNPKDRLRLMASAEIFQKMLDNEHYDPGNLGIKAVEQIMPRLIAQTGGLFILSEEDAQGMWSMEPHSVLPPLPFQKCWFEFWNENEPAALMHYKDWCGDLMVLGAFAVLEAIQASEWHCYALAGRKEEPPRAEIFSWRLLDPGHPESRDDVHLTVLLDPELGNEVSNLHGDEKEIVTRIFSTPIEIAQFISVQGVQINEQYLWRPIRRSFQRRFGIEHPKIYRVDLRGAGDSTNRLAGIREYHHRWIVRGHYRMHPEGKYLVPNKGSCIWIRPHVKGPAGAPWKGRPVYTASGTR